MVGRVTTKGVVFNDLSAMGYGSQPVKIGLFPVRERSVLSGVVVAYTD